VLPRAFPRTKNGIFFNSFSASAAQTKDSAGRAVAGVVRAQMRRRRLFVELGVLAEHREQMFFQTHHQRMNPGVKDDVGALEAHLWRTAGGKILDVHGRRNNGAGDA
jgi:hypothetical protein